MLHLLFSIIIANLVGCMCVVNIWYTLLIFLTFLFNNVLKSLSIINLI